MAPITLVVRRPLVRSRLTVATGALVAAITAFVPAVAARAQVAPVEPFWAAPTAETIVRSGDGEKFYPLARVKPETLLRVDAQGGGWSRVAYAPGMTVFIAADAVQLDPGGKSVRVVRPTHPRAAKLDTPRALGSWKPATEQPIAVGTVLTLAAPAAAEDAGGKTSYRVGAPHEARAFIATASLVRASPEQTAAYLNALRARGVVVAGMETPAAPTPTGPGVITEPLPKSQDGTLAQGDPGAPAKLDDKPKPRELTAAEKLEQSFAAIRRQPILDAEVAELIAQYEKAIAETEPSPTTTPVRRQLQVRLDYLKMQADLQAELRAIEAAKPQINDEVARAAERLKDVEQARIYNVVGRLSASTLYDGKRLPLMYRVQSVGGPLARTLGYLKPEEALKLEGKIGQIVGILGDSAVDPTLKITIITPRRVEVLTPAATPAPAEPAAEPPSEPAPPPSGG
ncbi:MAG: hypothetical protein ACKVU4_14295 [Phycisphaerales bacterium]